MLEKLNIQGVEIFRDTSVPFSPGLNVISGETGAGKSVLLACLLSTLGEEPPRELIREGYLESIWNGNAPSSLEHLLPEEDIWSLGRQIRDGRVGALCGGRSVAASLLQEAASQMVLRSGQHAAQELRDTSYHHFVLDQFAGIDNRAIKSLWGAWKEAEKSLQEKLAKQEAVREKEEFLRHEVELLRDLALEVGETDTLQEERYALLHKEERRESLSLAAASLQEDNISAAYSALEKISSYDPEAAALAERLERTLLEVEEARADVRSLLSDVDGQSGRLEDIERRLSDIQAVQRRFRGASEEELVQMLEKKEAELQLLDSLDEKAEEEEVAQKEEAFVAEAKILHQQRADAAAKLEKAVGEHLEGLSVEAKFTVQVEETEPSAKGITTTQFLLQRGERVSQIARSASGGEISRVALALLLATGSKEKFFIFDEIDTGVGGETAHLLADKLHALSQGSQVLVVSHLPQIALRADHLISLRRKEGQTEISESNSDKERQEELARLAGARGAESGASLEEMLREAAIQSKSSS